MVDDLEVFEQNYPELVAIDTCGRTREQKIEFLLQEREEMRNLTTATKIAHNVYLGNSADVYNSVAEYVDVNGRPATKGFDVVIECKDVVEIASRATLKDIESFLDGTAVDVPASKLGAWYQKSLTRPMALEFPANTSLPNSKFDPEAVVSFCAWVHHIAHTQVVRHTGADAMTEILSDNPATHRHVLIHCQDGYTESTFLALAYLIYAEGISAHEAWVKLHTELNRSFFAFDSDLKSLTFLQSYLLAQSPADQSAGRLKTPSPAPLWFNSSQFDGSFPSRILPHMYLGNLQHANNPEMLRTLGITRVLSIGEAVVWDTEKEQLDGMHLMYLDNVQDNGIDPLLDSIDPCLDFLGIPPLLNRF